MRLARSTRSPEYLEARKRLDTPGYFPKSEDLRILFDVHIGTVRVWGQKGKFAAYRNPGIQSGYRFSRILVRAALGLPLMKGEE